MSQTSPLRAFVQESNRIEGVGMTGAQVACHSVFLEHKRVTVDLMARTARVLAGPDALLRDKPGMDVRVGNHTPLPGGPDVRSSLAMFLGQLSPDFGGTPWSPYRAHHQYEDLHPFMDGNGRTGRLLWLWMMKQRGDLDIALRLGFLHTWYYQSLEAPR